MPLTKKGREIESNMKQQYGEKKGEQVFYASRNAGTISGVDRKADSVVTVPSGAPAVSEQLARHARLADGPVAQNRALQERVAAAAKKPC